MIACEVLPVAMFSSSFSSLLYTFLLSTPCLTLPTLLFLLSTFNFYATFLLFSTFSFLLYTFSLFTSCLTLPTLLFLLYFTFDSTFTSTFYSFHFSIFLFLRYSFLLFTPYLILPTLLFFPYFHFGLYSYFNILLLSFLTFFQIKISKISFHIIYSLSDPSYSIDTTV